MARKATLTSGLIAKKGNAAPAGDTSPRTPSRGQDSSGEEGRARSSDYVPLSFRVEREVKQRFDALCHLSGVKGKPLICDLIEREIERQGLEDRVRAFISLRPPEKT